MIKILFICHGNICRSPMAECILKKLVKDAGREKEFYIDSAATSYEEYQNPIYSAARDILQRHDIPVAKHYARVIEKKDYAAFDLIIGMEQINIRNMLRIFGGDPEGKIHLLMDFTETPGEVDDPWYSRRFEEVYQQIYRGCRGLLEKYNA